MDMAVLLLRESDKNAKADDFAIQEDVCRAYCESKGYGVYAVYKEAHSGKFSPHTRSVLRLAIDDIKSGRAQVLVIRTLDRLARTIEQQYYILFQVETMYHGRVEAAQEPIDRDSPGAKIQFMAASLASEIERDRIYERLEGGKKGRAAKGMLMGSPVPRYGYRWIDDTPGKRTAYEIDPTTSPIVQRMFTMLAEGQSLRAIARELNKQGVKTPSAYAAQQRDTGKRQVTPFWHAEQVRAIVTDERYAGQPVAYRTKTTREYKDGREVQVTRRSENAIALSTDVWPALITPEQFQLAQTRLQANVAGRKPIIQTLMRGHVYCGVCGSRMAISSLGKKPYTYPGYVCRKRPGSAASPMEACKSHGMLANRVDALGWEAVKNLMVNRENFTKLLRDRFSQPQDGAMLAAAAGALREAQEQVSTLAASIGMTSNEAARKAIVAQLETVTERVTKLEAQYKEAQALADSEKATESWIQTTLDRIYGWVSAWTEQTKVGAFAPTDEQMALFDALPFDVKRLAIDASGIALRIYPSDWTPAQQKNNPYARVNVTFEHPIDETMLQRFSPSGVQIDNSNQC